MDKTQEENIQSLVRRLENDYVNGTNTISKYVEKSMYEDLETIDAYLNSKHISGDRDSMGREKPFFNIVTAAVNIWYRATDIDRKHIRIKATRQEQYAHSFVATILLQEWMRRSYFGIFLNDWGRSLARYGSSVVKFVQKDGELISQVIPWNRLIVDPIDFDANPVIEKLAYTPAQLKQNDLYDQDMVDNLLDTRKARETIGKQKKDTRSDYIEVYEVHGNLPLSNLTGKEEDNDTYVQQMHVISFVGSGKGRNKEWEDFTLYSGREKKSPYMITHLIKEDGQTLSIGAVQHLFEAQWMVNHSMKQIKDHLDLASKLIFQTADDSFVGKNALTNIESGDILIHSPNAPLTQMNASSHDITTLQSFGNQWRVLAQEITSTPDALMGNTAPSGTAWRQVEALQQEAHSLFEIMIENKGLDIEKMMREYVIPHLKTKMDTTDELAAILDAQGIKKLQALYVPGEAVRRSNKKLMDMVLDGKTVTPEMQSIDIQNEMKNLQGMLSQSGSQRFIKPSEIDSKTWKESLKDLEWDIEVDITGESRNIQAVMTTLNTVFTVIAQNPNVLQDPKVAYIFNKILENTDALSPIELQQFEELQQQPSISPAPVGGSEVGGQLPVSTEGVV